METQYSYEGQQAWVTAYWNKNETHKNTSVASIIQLIRSVNINKGFEVQLLYA